MLSKLQPDIAECSFFTASMATKDIIFTEGSAAKTIAGSLGVASIKVIQVQWKM